MIQKINMGLTSDATLAHCVWPLLLAGNPPQQPKHKPHPPQASKRAAYVRWIAGAPARGGSGGRDVIANTRVTTRCVYETLNVKIASMCTDQPRFNAAPQSGSVIFFSYPKRLSVFHDLPGYSGQLKPSLFGAGRCSGIKRLCLLGISIESRKSTSLLSLFSV